MRYFVLSLVISFVCIPMVFAAEDQPAYPQPTVVSTTEPYSPPQNGWHTYLERFGIEDSNSNGFSSVPQPPKNIILFIGDGMGSAAVAAGRAATVGPAGRTHMDTMPVVGFVTTHSASDAVTDSAASGTAIASGQKTYNGAIGVDVDEKPLENVREWAESMGKSTGIVTTDRVTGATPASFYAHVAKRGQTADIAAQVPTSDVDVLVGGGMKVFEETREGATLRDAAEKNGFLVVDSLEALNEAVDQDQPVLGLLAGDAFPPSVERDYTLAAIVKAVIAKLSSDEDGFFLMVEGAQIDWAAHDNHAQHLVNEFADFDMGVGEALAFAASNRETLVLVTADHETGGVTLPKAPDVSVGTLGEGDYKPSVGIAFSTGSHTSIMVPIFAAGPGATYFGGVRDNTTIAPTIRSLWNAHD